MTVELPEGWREVALGQHIETIMGQAPSGSACNKDGVGTAFVKVGEFGATRPVIREWTTTPLKMAQEGDVLLCVVGATVGKVNHSIDCAIGRSVAALRPLKELTSSFLYHFISKQGELIKQSSRGSAQGVVTKTDIATFQLPLPPLAEQERIVEILEEQFSRLDSALASVKAVREKAKAFRRSLLHAAFRGELSGGTEGWREVALGEVAETQLGKMLNSKKQTGTAVMPYLRNINLRWGGFDLTDVKQMDIFPNEVEQFTLRNGDLLICEGGEPGRCAVWNRDGEMAFQNAMHRVRPHAELSPQFLALQFEARVRNGELEHLFSGVTIKHFSQSKLRAVEVPLPPLATQERIVEILEEQFSRLDKALEVANQLEARIAAERRSLLHSAFTGELTAKWRATHV